MSAPEVLVFLRHLAVERVSASIQNQAKAALLFLYRDVLGIGLLIGGGLTFCTLTLEYLSLIK